MQIAREVTVLANAELILNTLHELAAALAMSRPITAHGEASQMNALLAFQRVQKLFKVTPAAHDGPYSPELAAAFREGARDLVDDGDRVCIADTDKVEESEGGAIVHCTIYVSDSERAAMPGEDADDGCPKCDPDCQGNNGDSHDACEWPVGPNGKYRHGPDSCPTKHTNDGTDRCEHCGEWLA